MMDLVERDGEVVGFAQGVAKVRLERASSGCSGCGSRGTCASGNAAAQVIEMRLSDHTRIGDHVTVSMPSSSVTLAALLGYLLPPVSLLVGAVMASLLYGSDLAAVLGAALGLVAGLLLARLISRFAFGRRAASSACDSGFPSHHQSGVHP